MADVGSLGQYKVVVTADYSQLKTQFDAMSNFVSSTTKVMSDNLNKTMGGINATMISQLKTTVDQLKKSFDGLDTTTKKSGDGFKTYAQQIKEAEKAAQKCHQEISALQEKMANSSSVSNADVARLKELKAEFRELRERADDLKAAQADYNMRIKETQNLEAMAAKAKKQADQEGLKALRDKEKETRKLEETAQKAAKQAEEAAKKAGDGFKNYVQQIKAAKAEMEKAFQKADELQTRYNLINNDSVHGRADLAYLKESKLADTARDLKEAKAEAERLRIQYDRLVEAQKRFKEYAGQTQTAQKEQIREAIAGANAQIKAIDEQEKRNSRMLQGQMRAAQQVQNAEHTTNAQQAQNATRQSQRISHLQTQYRVAYEEINKYMQAHAKMSEAVFIRLQGRITALGNEIRRLGADPAIANPLAGMNYNNYASNFSKWTDFFSSLKHHLTWMASATAIGAVVGIPAKTISTIAEVEKQMAAMKQVNHDVYSNQLILNKTTQDFIGIAQQYGHSVDEIIKAGTLWGRQYKDLNEVMKLTTLSAKLAVADNMEIGLANRAVESVINGYQRQGDAVNFANHVVDSWTKIAHNAQSSATDLAEALMRTGAAAKAVGVDFDTTNALASAMIKSTGRSGAEVGNALKSLFSSIHSDKAIKQLEALGIQMYTVDTEGQKHFRNLHDVFMDLMITSHTTSQNMEKDLLAISGGKFQWSKVASVLGSYKDFLHAYTMSLDSTNFSQGQLEAQLNTITRKFEQLKATMTGIATGIGASGLSAYIKNILSSLNAFAKSLQGIPTYVWKIIGGLVALATAVGFALVVFKLLAAGISAVTTGVGLYTTAVTAGAIATEGMAAAATVATGGLNILLGLVIAGVAAFLGYNALIGSSIEAIDKESQALEDNVQIKRQQIEMSEKQGELIETLCNNHVKLQEALNTTKEGTEQHKRAEEDLAATDQELTAIIGENAMQQIDWNGDLQGSIKGLQKAHNEKTKQLRLDLASALDAQAAYAESEQVRIENEIAGLEAEMTVWEQLAIVVTNVCHTIASATIAAGNQIVAFGKSISSFIPSWGGKVEQLGQNVIATGEKYMQVNFHAKPEATAAAINATKIAALKNEAAKNKASAAKARLEAGAIRGTGGESNPYSNVSGGQEDSGVVNDDPQKGTKGTKGSKSPSGAKEADNSPEAMGYRYLTGKGLDKNMVLGILANIAHESSFNPDATNGDHWGMIQWDSDRWGRFLGEYLSMRGMSQSDYYSSDVNTKRTLQYDYIVHEMTKGAERGSYQKILDEVPSTPEQWAHLINKHYERSGVYSGGTDWERQKSAREYATRFERNNGEDNYTDGEKAIENAYKQAKKLFDLELQKLKYEREMKGEKVTALDEKALYEKIMFVNGKNPYALLEQAQKDYQKQLLEAAKYEAKRQEDIRKSTDTQVKAIEKMADAEIAFAKKLGLINDSDVRKYEWEKNESNYAKQKPLLEANLGSTVDMSKGTADDMLAAYRGYVNAKTDLDAKYYAEKMFNLSRDVDATMKALSEVYKLEQSYYEKRKKINDEEFAYRVRYATTFIDSLTNGIQSGLEGILNRTKSFAEAFRDIFKGLVQDIIKLFSQDFAERIKKWLSNAIFKPKATGNKAGAYEDIIGIGSLGGKKSAGSKSSGGFDLLGWASGSNGLSLLGGGKGKGKVGSNPILTAMGLTPNLAQQAKAMFTPVTYTLRNSMQNTIAGMSNISQQGMYTISAGVQSGTQMMGATWTTFKNTQVATDQMGNMAIIGQSQATAATVQATTAQMMGWLMAVLALFSLFGGGGGSSTTESHDAVNLGRSPDSYYMTPSAVLQSTTFQVPSFDIGGNIEQDMFAMVHKGEMVLTPEQAEVIRNTARTSGSVGNGNTNANVKSSINVTTVSSRGFEQVLRDYNRDLSKNVKKGIRNGYLTAKGLM